MLYGSSVAMDKGSGVRILSLNLSCLKIILSKFRFIKLAAFVATVTDISWKDSRNNPVKSKEPLRIPPSIAVQTTFSCLPSFCMVMWYICDISTILPGLRINDFFSLRVVCSTYLTMAAWCGQHEEFSVVISFTQQFVFQSCSFFSWGIVCTAA